MEPAKVSSFSYPSWSACIFVLSVIMLSLVSVGATLFMSHGHVHGGIKIKLGNHLFMSGVHREMRLVWNCNKKVNFQRWERNGTKDTPFEYQHQGLTSDSTRPSRGTQACFLTWIPGSFSFALWPSWQCSMRDGASPSGSPHWVFTCVPSAFPSSHRPVVQQYRCQIMINQSKSSPLSGTSPDHAQCFSSLHQTSKH